LTVSNRELFELEKLVKILHIGKYYPPYYKGGIEDHVMVLCEELKREIQVEVLVANNKIKTEIDHINEVSFTKLGRWAVVAGTPVCPALLYRINKYSADIIHVHMPNPWAELCLLTTKLRKKLVASFHCDIIRQKSLFALYRPFLLRFLKKVDRIIAATPLHIEYSPVLGQFKDKCRVIPYGINPDRFRPDTPIVTLANSIRQKTQNSKIILFVGRLVYYKGLDYLIKAMKNIAAVLLVVGTGPLLKTMQELVKTMQLEKKVLFAGEISEEQLPAYYRACDVFVLPSTARTEAFGIVQLEAMSSYKPVISTNLKTGVPYVNQDGKTGIVVPPADSEILAEAIQRLLTNEALCRQMGENGYRRVREEFTKERMGQRTLALYQDVLSNT